MHYAVSDFGCTSLIPILAAKVSTSSAADLHFGLIAVVTVRAFPEKLSVFFDDFNFVVPAADFAKVRFSVHFGIHDSLMNILNDFNDDFKVMREVGNFDVTDSAAGGEGLEFRFKFELGESVNFFADVDVVAVGNIIMVTYVLNFAEVSLEGFGEGVGG